MIHYLTPFHMIIHEKPFTPLEYDYWEKPLTDHPPSGQPPPFPSHTNFKASMSLGTTKKDRDKEFMSLIVQSSIFFLQERI